MFKFLITLALVACSMAYAPASRMRLKMSFGTFTKVAGIAAAGFLLTGPIQQNAVADGAVSKSTVFRARLNYGSKILDLASAADKADFAAFEDKKSQNAFDLFISGANALNGKIDKEHKASEKAILANIKSAVSSKDASKLRSSYSEFIKVADLKSDYKPGELGQTDSSGYSPTYGTARQYIYQR